MSEAVLYTVLVTLVTFLLAAIWYFRQKDAKGGGGGGGEVRPRVPRPRVGVEDGVAAAPNRVIAQRNARGRMRAAAVAHHHDEDSDDGEGNVGDDIALPDGKVGKKKLAKLQAKADRRVMREAEEREREERKERKEKAEVDRKKDEKKEAKEVAMKEEEERKEREEKARREQEEYEKMKAMFDVEEEGEGYEETDEDKEKSLLNEFVGYIKSEKVVVLEDLASKFKLKTQDVISRLTVLQKDGTLTGVIDDRGKFIYISRQELEGVAKFIRQRGRVSLAELAESSASLVTLTPDTPVQS